METTQNAPWVTRSDTQWHGSDTLGPYISKVPKWPFDIPKWPFDILSDPLIYLSDPLIYLSDPLIYGAIVCSDTQMTRIDTHLPSQNVSEIWKKNECPNFLGLPKKSICPDQAMWRYHNWSSEPQAMWRYHKDGGTAELFHFLPMLRSCDLKYWPVVIYHWVWTQLDLNYASRVLFTL